MSRLMRMVLAIAVLGLVSVQPSAAAVSSSELAALCPPLQAGGSRPVRTIDPGNSSSTVDRFPNTSGALPGWYADPAAGTLVDAGRGNWKNPPQPDAADPDGKLVVGTPVTLSSNTVARSERCLVGGDISIGLPYAATSFGEWHGDADPLAAGDGVVWSPAETGGVESNNPRTSIIGSNIYNVGDGVSFFDRNGVSADDWLLDGVRMTDIHDDCVENDSMNGGRIVDSLFDGCYVLYSANTGGNGGAGVDGSANTVEIHDSLFHLKAAPDSSRRCSPTGPPSCYAGPLQPGTGVPWKISELPVQGHAPNMTISGSTFLLDGYQLPDPQCPQDDGVPGPCSALTKVNYRFPTWCRSDPGTDLDPNGVCDPPAAPVPYAPSQPAECPAPNLVIWAGADSLVDGPETGDIASQLATWGPCFQVVDADDIDPSTGTTWRTVWEDRRRAWIAEHSAGGSYVDLGAPVLAYDSTQASSTLFGNVPLTPASTRTIDLSAVPGLPSNSEVGSVNLRVTVTNPTSQGGVTPVPTTLTVWGDGTRPGQTSLTVRAGETGTADVVVLPGREGRRLTPGQVLNPAICPTGQPVCPSDGSSIEVYNAASTVDVKVEVLGYHRANPAVAGDVYRPIAPVRRLDTSGGGAVASGAVRNVVVAGAAGIPANATAVMVNVGVRPLTAPTGAKVWPTGAPEPTNPAHVANVVGTTTSTGTIVKVGSGGSISLKPLASDAHFWVDVVGYFLPPWAGAGGTCGNPGPTDPCIDSNQVYPAGNSAGLTASQLRFHPLVPTRIAGTGAVGAGWNPAGGFTHGSEKTLVVTGAGVPADAKAVVLNLHVTAPSVATNFKAWADGTSAPTAVVAHAAASRASSTTATVAVGTGGQIRVRNNAGTNSVNVDVVGFYR